MKSAGMYWVLLLGWGLLLGQPVSTHKEECCHDEQLEEALVEALNDQEGRQERDTLPEQDHHRHLEDLLDPEDPEEPRYHEELPDPEEIPIHKDPEHHLDHHQPTEEEIEELLEEQARDTRHLLEHSSIYGSHLVSGFKHLAIQHLKQKEGADYQHLEDTHTQIKKAIGTMIQFRIFLVKVHCEEDPDAEDPYADFPHFYPHFEKPKKCEVPPEAEQEKLDCTFSVFMDARSGRDAVVDYRCKPLHMLKEDSSSSEYYHHW